MIKYKRAKSAGVCATWLKSYLDYLPISKQPYTWILMGALILNVSCRPNPVENSAIVEEYFDQCFAAFEAGNYDAAFQYAQVLYEPIIAVAREADPDANLAFKLSYLNGVFAQKNESQKAIALTRLALNHVENALGPNHEGTATVLNRLAVLYHANANYVEAETLYKRALSISEQTLEPYHPDYAMRINNLAMLYYRQGNYAKAEPLFKRAFSIREKTLGPDHPHTAASLNNLAFLYYDQGNYVEAEPFIKRALIISEKTLGPDHPDIAMNVNNLAMVYYSQGNYAGAEPLFKRALSINEKNLGPSHPGTAMSINNLAMLYREQVRWPRTLDRLQ